MADLPARRFRARDGVELAWREVGDGRPLVLLHGLMGTGTLMASDGPARAIAARGYRVILPDLRGHGDSGHPHDPDRYPPDVLADDGLDLIDHLGLGDYHLAGYSLGGKVVLRLLARGARPGHAIVGGQGLDALDAESDRTDGHRRNLAAVASGDALSPGSPEESLAQWLRESGADPKAIGLVLGTSVATSPDALRHVPTPTLVAVGDSDSRSATAGSLAELLPHGRLVLVPGDHFAALEAPEFTAAVLDFLGQPRR
jgi:pimeloyl-ACP methyl ester carboxylesterase